ncbi:MAG: peptidoglycan binding domain-containing protein, partial [Candidatus Limnocylindria bacterium]
MWGAAGLAVRISHRDRLLPGTQVAGIDLGGLSRAEASSRLAGLPPAIVAVTHRRRSFRVGARQIGLRVDVAATAERAMQAGRDGTLDLLIGGASALWSRRDLSLSYEEVDSDRLDDAIDAIAHRVDREPFAGALSIDPETLRVRARAPRPGREVMQRRAAAAMLDALRRRVEVVELPVRRRSARARIDVGAVARRAREYLTEPLRLSGPGGATRLAPS